jgi:hypothetical protein
MCTTGAIFMTDDIRDRLQRLCEEQRAELTRLSEENAELLAALEEFVAWQSCAPEILHRSPIDIAADARIAIAKTRSGAVKP